MKLGRLVAVVVGAVMAMCLVSVATASALLPLFLPGAAGNTFTTTSEASVLTGGGNVVTCKADKSTGEITGPMNVGNVIVTFTGCTSKAAGSATVCTVKGTDPGGQAEGEIKTLTLIGALGLILQSAGVPLTPGSDAGLFLEPAKGSVFVALSEGTGTAPCTPATKVTGQIAGVVEPVATGPTKTGKIIFSTNGAAAQGVKKIDLLGGRREPELVAFSETATEVTTDVITYTTEVEVM